MQAFLYLPEGYSYTYRISNFCTNKGSKPPQTYGDTVVDWAAVTSVTFLLEGAELWASIWLGMFNTLVTSLLIFSFDGLDDIITTSSVVDDGPGDTFSLFRRFNTREDRSVFVDDSQDWLLSLARSSTVRGMGGTGVLSSLDSGPGRAAAIEVYKKQRGDKSNITHDQVI